MHIDHLGAQSLAASVAQEALAARTEDLAATARKNRLAQQRLAARANAQNPDLEVTEQIEEEPEEKDGDEPAHGGFQAKA
jgi:hypothetical protein